MGPKWNDLLHKVVNEEEIDFEDVVSDQFVEEIINGEVQFIKSLRKE